MKRLFGSCLVAWVLLTSGVAPASAQNVAEVSDLAALIQSIPDMRSPEGDEFFDVYLHCDLGAETALLAWQLDDEAALQAVIPVLEGASAAAAQMDDPYTRDYALVFKCLATAALGDLAAAERDANRIARLDYRSYAIGMLAADCARDGDRAGYERLSTTSLEILENALLADGQLAQIDRELPSWVAWAVQSRWLRDAIHSDLYEPEATRQQLQQLAVAIEALPLEPGASAECLSAIAATFVFMGDQQAVRQWLAAGIEALAQERAVIVAAGNDLDFWSYGTDAGRIDIIRVQILLGETDAALRQMEQIESAYFQAVARSSFATHCIATGESDLAPPHLDAVEQYIAQADNVIDLQIRGKSDPVLEQSDHWSLYSSEQLLYEVIYLAGDIARAGDVARLERLVGVVHTDLARIAIRIGAMNGRLDPLPTLQAE